MSVTDDYVFWQGKRIPSTALPHSTKSVLLDNAMRKVAALEKSTKATMRQAGLKEDDIESILSGRIFQNFANQNSIPQDLGAIDTASWPKDVYAAMQILNTPKKEISTISQLMDKLKNFFDNLDQEKLNLMAAYEEQIIQDFKNEVKGTKSTHVGSGDVYSKIVNSILGRYNQEAFRVRPDLGSRNSCLLKLYMLYKSLPFYTGSTEIRHRGTAVGSGTKGSLGEVTSGVVDKAFSYLRGFNKSVAEYSFAYGTILGDKEFNKAMEPVNWSVNVVGDISVSTNWTPSKPISEIGKLGGTNWNGGGQIVSKPDVQITYGGNGVTGVLNFSVKEYSSQNPTLSSTSPYTLKAQDGTDLFTLLVREAGFNASQINYAIRVAAGTAKDNVNKGQDSKSTNLEAEWNEIKRIASYKAVLSTLAGLATATGGQNLFMVLNGQVFTMRQVLNSLRRVNSDVLISYATTKGSSQSAGLNRSTYESINISNYVPLSETGGNISKAAEQRSKAVRPKIIGQMQRTKIKVEVRLSELANISKLT